MNPPTKRGTCADCSGTIWYRRSAPPGWQHNGSSDHPARLDVPIETNYEPDVDAELADERSKELRFGPWEDPPEDDVAHGVDFTRTDYAEWSR